MYQALSPGAIGVKTNNLAEAIAAAKTGGFEAVEFNPKEVADLIDSSGAGVVVAQFEAAGIRPAAFGVPVNWRASEEEWNTDLESFPRLARAAAAIGATRCATWVPPGSNDKAFEENYRFHVQRFGPIAKILGDNGIGLGLEFIGPKTLRDNSKYPFVYTLPGMLALGKEIGPNVGLLLDCWHWYTSHGTVAELRALRPEQVVYVHVNDAPAGIDIDSQFDHTRALPGETGVIDIVSFLQSLKEIGYDGPVTPEPFKKELNELPSDEDRLRTVKAGMDKIWNQAGLE